MAQGCWLQIINEKKNRNSEHKPKSRQLQAPDDQPFQLEHQGRSLPDEDSYTLSASVSHWTKIQAKKYSTACCDTDSFFSRTAEIMTVFLLKISQ